MADIIDQAQAAEEAHREDALAAHGRRAAAQLAGSPLGGTDCRICGNTIEAARRKTLPFTNRCASCAHEFERELKHA